MRLKQNKNLNDFSGAIGGVFNGSQIGKSYVMINGAQ